VLPLGGNNLQKWGTWRALTNKNALENKKARGPSAGHSGWIVENELTLQADFLKRRAKAKSPAEPRNRKLTILGSGTPGA
jgi:hypothetical protein